MGEVNLKLFYGWRRCALNGCELFYLAFVRRPGLSHFTLDAQRPWPRPRPPSPLSISWQPFPALFCWERSNTFCRHCCPVMGKNFCDWNSQVTWLKVCFLFWFFFVFHFSRPPLALNKASSTRSKNIENCFLFRFFVFFLPLFPGLSVFAFIFVKFSLAVIFFFGWCRSCCCFCCCTWGTFCTRQMLFQCLGHFFVVSPPFSIWADCIEIRVPRCAWMIFVSCKYFIDYYSACSRVAFSSVRFGRPCPYCSVCESFRVSTSSIFLSRVYFGCVFPDTPPYMRTYFCCAIPHCRINIWGKAEEKLRMAFIFS